MGDTGLEPVTSSVSCEKSAASRRAKTLGKYGRFASSTHRNRHTRTHAKTRRKTVVEKSQRRSKTVASKSLSPPVVDRPRPSLADQRVCPREHLGKLPSRRPSPRDDDPRLGVDGADGALARVAERRVVLAV